MALLLLASLPFLLKAATLGTTGYALQSSYKVLQLILPMLWYRRMGKRGKEEFYPAQEMRPSWKLLSLAVLSAIALAGSGVLALHFVILILALDSATLRVGFDARFAMGPMGALFVVLFLASANAYLEEWHFRWWLDFELTRQWGRGVGIALSAAAFAFMHAFIVWGLPGVPSIAAPLMAAGLFIAGIVWSVLLRRAGGFYAAWFSHGLTDALLLSWGLWWLGYF